MKYNKQAQDAIITAGRALATVFEQVRPHIEPGMSTKAIDQYIESYLQQAGLVSQCKGYKGYPCVSCISVNHQIVHGIPSAHVILQEGDLVKVDVCTSLSGYCADMARCFSVGSLSKAASRLVSVAQNALLAGIEKAVPSGRVGDVSAAIEDVIVPHKYGIVYEFSGHGIGKQMHEDPEILNFGRAGTGPRLQEGMALAIEPMITMGSADVHITKDGWTAESADKSLAAHVEDTVVITEHGPCVATQIG